MDKGFVRVAVLSALLLYSFQTTAQGMPESAGDPQPEPQLLQEPVKLPPSFKAAMQGAHEQPMADLPQAYVNTYDVTPQSETDEPITTYSPAVPASSTQIFDELEAFAGNNIGGSAGGFFSVTEWIEPLGFGDLRYWVIVGSRNSSDVAEPWLSSDWSGLNASKWKLRVGGTDRIDLPSSGLVLASGIAAFNSALDPAPGYALTSDNSNSVTLAGVGVVPSDGNIAGDDVAYVAMFWEVQPVATTSDLFLLEVDANEGVYAPGNNLQVKLKIQNFGSDYSAVTNVSLYLSTDNAIGLGDSLVGTLPIPSLNVFESYDVVASGPIPAVTNGSYVVGAIINYADTNLANNTNFDLHEITVSTAPEIQVQPLALDFEEQSGSLLEYEELQQSVDRVAVASTAVFSELAERARKDGQVRVIVGYESAFQPEGVMSASQAQDQRQRISDRADQVLDLIKGTPAQEYRRFDFIPFLALSVDEAALQALANSPLVISIEEDTISSPHLSSSSAVIGSPLAWAEGADGAGVAIAVLDTGIDKNHSWFSTGGNRVVSEACYSTSGPTTIGTSSSFCPGGAASSTAANSGLNCALNIPGCDHGTHVGGIVAGNDGSGPNFGVARGANLVAMQVFSQIDDFSICFTIGPCIRSYKSDQIKALERVLAIKDTHNIAAVNMSLGEGQYSDQAACDAANPSIKAAIDNLRSVGIATVISAGNDGFRDSIGAPGCVSSAISVGNTTDADGISFTSNVYSQLHLLAPGTDITSAAAGGGTSVKTGTSMAAPQVAGAWAVLKQLDPAASVVNVLNNLQATGTQVDDLRPSGSVQNIPRINLDVAIGEPRTSFSIRNLGAGVLNITSINLDSPAPWITWSPLAPFSIQPGELKVVTVYVDYDLAPNGATQRRLLINSNDSNESPFPGGVYIDVIGIPEELIFESGFENP
jgi:hypothetical protein